jgi:polyhydroxyalkanoate synthesis regulator phasin
MMVSKNTSFKLRCLQAGVLLCAMIVLPLNIASAADFEAVERKLGEAVAEGYLSLNEAKVMFDALRKSGHFQKHPQQHPEKYPQKHDKKAGHKPDHHKEGQANHEAIWNKLQAMVKAGQITEKQAHQKMGEIKKQAKGKHEGKGDGDERMRKYREIEEKVHAAVRAGKMSKEDAHRKLESIKKEIFSGGQDKAGNGGGDERARKFREIETEIHEAVNAGKMSREDAHRKLEGLKREIFGQHLEKSNESGGREHRRFSHEDFRRAEAELEKLIDQGKISQEDARKRLDQMRRAMAQQGERERGERERK